MKNIKIKAISLLVIICGEIGVIEWQNINFLKRKELQ